MPRIIYFGGYENYIKNKDNEVKEVNPQDSAPSKVESSDDEEEEEVIPLQTFPCGQKKVKVVRQKDDDLTCGLRCLQNMYGEWLVDREEMDSIALELQERSHGIELFNPNLGFYAMEVLEAVLQRKGKWVQRIDTDKITSDYYIPVIEQNPTFSGYIVTLGTGTLKHYIAIRFSGSYRKIDSMPGVAPCQIPPHELFKRRSDGHLYCCNISTEPVVSVSAIAGGPFVEYNLLHSTWSLSPPPVKTLIDAISDVLDYSKQSSSVLNSEEKDWYRKWMHSRTPPSSTVLNKLVSLLRTGCSLERDVIVHLHEQRTIIRCIDLNSLISNLKEMGWIQNDIPFTFVQGEFVKYNSENLSGSIDWFEPIRIEPPKHPQVGGFYTFRSSVAGTCTEKQEGTYSVRDKDGVVHVLFKKTVENIVVSTK